MNFSKITNGCLAILFMTMPTAYGDAITQGATDFHFDTIPGNSGEPKYLASDNLDQWLTKEQICETVSAKSKRQEYIDKCDANIETMLAWSTNFNPNDKSGHIERNVMMYAQIAQAYCTRALLETTTP